MTVVDADVIVDDDVADSVDAVTMVAAVDDDDTVAIAVDTPAVELVDANVVTDEVVNELLFNGLFLLLSNDFLSVTGIDFAC